MGSREKSLARTAFGWRHARRITDKCTNQEKYDKQINAWYELALHDENEEIQHHAADSLFGFYLRKKDYTKAEKYLDYFSEYDPMKSYYQGRLLQKHSATWQDMNRGRN